MEKNPIISFLAGLLITTLIVGVLAVCYLLLTFNLAGGETLSEVESRNFAQLIISILILIVAIFCARHFSKNNKKYTARGIIVFPLIVVLAAAIYLFDQNFDHTKFDKASWEQEKWKPEKMAKTLVKEKTLIGMTRGQVKDMLGESSEEYENENSDNGSMFYSVKNEWTLIILFEKDRVVEVKLQLPYLGV